MTDNERDKICDEDEVRRIMRKEFEIFINSHHWPDRIVMEILLEMAQDKMWKKGFMVRFRYWANIIGMLGIFGSALLAISYFLGFEVVRK